MGAAAVTDHTHPGLAHDGGNLRHEHYRGDEGHTHSEEIELVIAKLLKGRDYTGLSPAGQRVVAAGIATMRRALVDVAMLSEEAERRYPPPNTQELRAPLVTRHKSGRLPAAPAAGDASGHPWTLSNTARCGQCFRQSRRRFNPDTQQQYGPAVIFHADDCPDRPVGRRS